LQGKWLKLAKLWLQDNMPCTMQDYIINVAPLMPVHIISSGKRARQVVLARSALKKLHAIQDESGSIVSLPEKKSFLPRYDHEQTLRLATSEDGLITLPKGQEKKERHAFETWLRRRAVRVGHRQYRLVKDKESTK
jgi:hypothetical protein